MRTLSYLCVSLISFSGRLVADEKADLEKAEEQAFKQAAALVSPSLVRIDTVGGLDIVGNVLTGTGPTTGVAVTQDGYIISSAFNFISEPASVLVTLNNGKRLAAKIVATDKLNMITLLKVNSNELKPPRVVKNSDLKVGQWAIALGKTFDSATPSVSVGIVSALNRVWGKAIQTDAKISPVNYGGPLIDVNGGVMGILVPISPRGNTETAGVEWYDSGIGFAIPLEHIYNRLDRLKEGKDILPGLAGISFKGRDVYANAAVVDRVRYDSPAWKAGLKKDDTIVEMAGQPVMRIAQVMQVLKSKLEGESVTLKYKRGETITETSLTLVGKLVPWEPPFLGILPRRLGTDEKADGVVIRHVFKESPADKAGIASGDTITKLNGEAIADLAALTNSISRIRPRTEVEIEFKGDGKIKTAKVMLESYPTEIPQALPSASIGAATGDEKDKARTGRFTEKLPGYEQELWAYVPESYNADYPYGLLVFTHPSNDSMEATIYREWKSICELRGIILLAPKAAKLTGWTPNESDYVKDTIEAFQERYNIDSNRVAIHGFGNGAVFAASTAFKHREHIRGVVMAGAGLRQPPPENQPDLRLQFHLVCGDKDPQARFVQLTQVGLRRLKIPVTRRIVKDLPSKYPPRRDIEEIGRWLDMLDRI